MHCWKWHHFEDETEIVEPDEFDQYNFVAEDDSNVQVAREFWAGNLDSGQLYTVVFVKIERKSILDSFLGEMSYQGLPLAIPKSGAWVVTFDLANEENDFAHVELSFRAKRDLVAGVACAVYDHYNVTKAGLYCWYAASEKILSIYDTALGFDDERVIKVKALPFTQNFKRLGDKGRGYAIITQYY